jgi:membrane protein implicated in regulation of membrane protease activity
MTDFTMIFWYWWMLAMLLLAIELLAAGFFFLWMAFAAGITGVVLLLIPSISLAAQVMIFSVVSFCSIILWRKYGKSYSRVETDHPLLNQRGAQYIGRVFTLIDAVVNGQGKVKIGDSLWTVSANEDYPAGTKVKVTGVDGTILQVEKAE